MIIGHLGPALAARWRWPRTALPWLLAATLAPDLLRESLQLGGMDWRVATRFSHLLPWSLLFAVLVGAASLLAAHGRGERLTGAAVVAGVVMSHVALDMLSGHKQLWTGGPRGLGLGDYMQLEFVLEGALLWWGWRLARRDGVAGWLTSVPALVILLALQAVYLHSTFEARPYATRCVEYPVRPCWIRRKEHPYLPVAAPDTTTISRREQ